MSFNTTNQYYNDTNCNYADECLSSAYEQPSPYSETCQTTCHTSMTYESCETDYDQRYRSDDAYDSSDSETYESSASPYDPEKRQTCFTPSAHAFASDTQIQYDSRQSERDSSESDPADSSTSDSAPDRSYPTGGNTCQCPAPACPPFQLHRVVRGLLVLLVQSVKLLCEAVYARNKQQLKLLLVTTIPVTVIHIGYSVC